MMTIRKKAILAILAGSLLLSVGCSKPAESTSAEATPTPEQKKTVEAFGKVEINEIRNINLDFEPVVEAVHVKEGQRVKQGDILITLNMKDYQSELTKKQHELNTARLEVQKLQNKLLEEQLENNSDPDIKKLVSDLSYADSLYQKGLKDQEAQETLYQSGSLSKHDYDTFVKSVDAAKKAVDDIRYSLDIALHEKKLGNKELNDSIAIAKERTATIESEIRVLKNMTEKSYIKGNTLAADMDGIVYDIGYKVGDRIGSGDKVLSLMNLDTMVVKANVAEEFIKDVKLGAAVEIIPLADKGKAYKGKVLSLAGQAMVENGETVVPVEITIDQKDAFLLPNFNVDVKIDME